VEHDPVWAERVKQGLAEHKVQNVNYLPIRLDVITDRKNADYVRSAERFADASLDFVLVDGRLRDECALAVLAKLRPGGLLVIDNADAYLPSKMHTPNARSTPDGIGWARFLELVRGWRNVWMCNGIYATAMWFKPYDV
jgi:predicted O-methyltransferase YrrM